MIVMIGEGRRASSEGRADVEEAPRRMRGRRGARKLPVIEAHAKPMKRVGIGRHCDRRAREMLAAPATLHFTSRVTCLHASRLEE